MTKYMLSKNQLSTLTYVREKIVEVGGREALADCYILFSKLLNVYIQETVTKSNLNMTDTISFDQF